MIVPPFTGFRKSPAPAHQSQLYGVLFIRSKKHVPFPVDPAPYRKVRQPVDLDFSVQPLNPPEVKDTPPFLPVQSRMCPYVLQRDTIR